MTRFTIHRPFLIGVVHLAPLPGSPGWSGSIDAILERALADARSYRDGGMNAVVVENFGDVPFFKSGVPAETVAAMARSGAEVHRELGTDFPLGFNVLRNDALAALGLCAACGGSFVRVNVHTGAMVTDQGVIEGDAATTLRHRSLVCPDAAILADVMVKHASPLAANPDLVQAARDTVLRGLADALIVTVSGTGEATAPEDLVSLRKALPDTPLLVGSGADADSIGRLLQWADGAIVGTSLKEAGRLEAPVDPDRVAAFVAAANEAH